MQDEFLIAVSQFLEKLKIYANALRFISKYKINSLTDVIATDNFVYL